MRFNLMKAIAQIALWQFSQSQRQSHGYNFYGRIMSLEWISFTAAHGGQQMQISAATSANWPAWEASWPADPAWVFPKIGWTDCRPMNDFQLSN